MEAYSTLIWKIIGAAAVLFIASKLLALLSNPQTQNTANANPTTSTTRSNANQVKPEVKSETTTPTIKQSNQVEKVIQNTPTKQVVATPEKKKEVFAKDVKDRETDLERRKRELFEKNRGKMLDSMSGPKNVPLMPTSSSPVISSPVTFPSPVTFSPPVMITPVVTSPKVAFSPFGELHNPVPQDQQILNSNLSKSSPSPLVNRTPVVEEKKPAKLSQSQSPNRSRKEKPVEEGLCLQTGEIKTIPTKISLEEDRETKRRLAMEAYNFNNKK
jgi:hypothetical protein